MNTTAYTNTHIQNGPGLRQQPQAPLQHRPQATGSNVADHYGITPDTAAVSRPLTALEGASRALLDPNLDRYSLDQVGYACLGTIRGNPEDKSIPLHHHWYAWPVDRDQALSDLADWADRGLNTYVAPCLFTEPQRSYDTALPCDWLWLDDVAIAGAELVRTSQHKYQSWLKLDRAINARERQHLQAAIRDQHPGADNCSKDAIHMARAIGGWHTKGEPWQVRLIEAATQVFLVDQLFAIYGQPDPTLRATSRTNDLPWHALPNGKHLAQSSRFVRLRAKNEQLDRVCTGLPVALMMKNGRLDDSASNARAVFVYQLIRARYPLVEAQALYEHFADVLGKAADFYSDFQRLWQHYQPATYRPEATRSQQPSAPAPIGGRHYEITAAELLDYYASIADSRPMGTRADVTLIDAATALGVSVSTIRRREAELIAAGQLRRCVTDDRQSSYVLIGAYVCSQPIATADQASSTPIGVCTEPQIAQPAPEPIEHVCSQFDAPQSIAEYVPLDAVCEEQARGIEITYTPSPRVSLDDPEVSVLPGDSLPDAAPGLAQVPGGYVVSQPADAPLAYQSADEPALWQTLPELAAEAIAVYGMPPVPTADQQATALADGCLMQRLRAQKPETPDPVLIYQHIKRTNNRAHLAVLRGYVVMNASRIYGKKAISQAVQTALFKADLMTATRKRLATQLRTLEGRIEVAQKLGSRQANHWAFKALLVREELQRRPVEPTRPARKETAPQLSEAARERIAEEQLDLAWQALEDDRRTNGRIQPRTAATPTETPAPNRPAYEQPGFVAGMIARFKARQYQGVAQ